jgi:RNA polymerase sigma factor (sigma-70 family)
MMNPCGEQQADPCHHKFSNCFCPQRDIEARTRRGRSLRRNIAYKIDVTYVIMAGILLRTTLLSIPSLAFSVIPLRTHQYSMRITETMSNDLTATATRVRYTRLKIDVAAKSSMMAVQKVEPLTQTSNDRRSRAVCAMNRAKVENALLGIDPQTIEMLSSQFLAYPSNRPSNSKSDKSRKRPKGRPESVPGAMTQETMARYLEHQSAMKTVHSKNGGLPIAPSDLEVMVIAPYMETSSASPMTTFDRLNVGSENKTTRQRRKLKGVKTKLPSIDLGELPTANISGTTIISQRGRKRVFKNLPKAKNQQRKNQSDERSDGDGTVMDDAMLRPTSSKSRNPSNGMDINQYYRTELLTSDEEYSLGMKIQFMDKCEQVHEGLASAMNQLPTFEEWAVACGFTEKDPNFVATEADEQLRPIGSDAMFEDMDPNMFVGNGLAHQTGPGRGRGRVKRVPPVGLKDIYDDSEYRIQLKDYVKNRGKDKSIQRPRRSELVRPINRGTPTDFVEMLMTAHEAKQRMVQSNMRLVISIARKYANAGVNLQDLVQEGSLGLSRAAEKFEPKKGFKFSTYASWWIQQAVFRSIAYHSRTIRLPVHVHNLLNRVRKVRQTLQSELGRAPTNEEIAEQLGMTRQKFNKMLHLTKQSISLEAPKYRSNPKDLGHESDDLLGDTISKSTILEDEATPQKSVDHGLFHDDLKAMMKILDDDEHRVICARYGLQDGLTRTVTAVAAQMKQSKAWVRSQECRALRKLRRPWYEKKLKEHQDALAF